MKARNNPSITNKWIGPYKFIKTIRTRAYRLEVPKGTRWYNIVQTTLLKALQTRDDPQDMDEYENNEIGKDKTIINYRKYAGVVKYRIQWKGSNEL